MDLTNIRPWGEYMIVEQTKIINIQPNESLSLQYHNFREENWKIEKGNGYIYVGSSDNIFNKYIHVKVGDTFHINKKEIHRAIAGKDGLSILEKSIGIIDEDDIVRLEDEYGRK